ncbi:MAG: CoA protein activase [Peptococcaceae bacterium]|jgi:predicted nucleotide-binding protein (sugar kinase/HSP70/actin superfamily)|nr:CoA protein activase [Peptococcaceae bacterium]
MNITFPHMGNMHIPLKSILQNLGLEVIVPPPTSKKTLTLGAKYAPEFACLPLKLNLGNYIEACESGADTVLMAGGCGPCRFGYYAQIEESILKDIGCNMEFIVLEPPDRRITDVLGKIKKIAGKNSWWDIFQAIRLGYKKAKAVDDIEKVSHKLRPREIVHGSTDRVYQRALKAVDDSYTYEGLAAAIEQTQVMFNEIAVEEQRNVLKVGFVGEIYTLLDPFSNQDLERRLGYLNVEVDRSVYLSEWVNDHICGGMLQGGRKREEVLRSAHPYLCHFVGGHGQETIGSTVYYARSGYDGVIQAFPFTCMPEIVAESILPDISLDKSIPCLTLIMDEQNGASGVQTRLEAFVDLMEQKRASNMEKRSTG